MQTSDRIKYFLYARRSTTTEDRQIRSIPDQIAEIRGLAQRQSLEIVDILTESLTARKPGRPEFNKMLQRLEAGEAQGIIAWHPDRLSRNPLDNGRLLDLLERGKIKDLKFSTMHFELSPAGLYMLSMMLCQSVYYSANLSTNIKRTFDNMVRRGIWPEKTSIGYVLDRAHPGGQVIDPDRSSCIARAYELYATGNYSFAQIRDVLHTMGLTTEKGRPVSISKVQFILTNPIYHGIIRWKKELHEGQFQPIISKQLFDKVQAVMKLRSRRRRVAKKLKPYLYRQMFSCGGCGATMTIETQKGHNYLRCTRKVRPCIEPFIREESVAQQISQSLSSIALPVEITDWVLAELQRQQLQQVHEIDEKINQLRAQARKKNLQINRLIDAFSSADLSHEEFRNAKNSALLDKRTFEEQAVKLEKTRLGWLEPAIEFVKVCKQATKSVEDEDFVKQRDFFRKAGSNRRITNRRVSYELTGAWKTLVNAGRFAHHPGAASHDAAPFAGEPDQHRAMWAIRDSNP